MEAQWKTLAAHVLIRAAVDATGTNETEQQEALNWLNSPSGRGVIGIFGLHIAGAIKAEDLNQLKRNVYFNGAPVSQETFLAGHDAGRK